MLTVALIQAAGTAEDKQRLLPGLADGSSIGTVAVTGARGTWTSAGVDVTAGADGTLTGSAHFVTHGQLADVILVVAQGADGTAIFHVEADAPGFQRTPATVFDRTVPLSTYTFADTPATALGAGGDATAVIAEVLDVGRIAAANEAIGLMEVALEMTSSYLKSRKQFGVTLNTFQALTFRSADMYVSLELARSMATWATMVLAEDGAEDASVAASRAGLQISRAGRHIGQEAIQLHGGIGVTAEYAIGNYTSRLTALDHLLGDGNHHLGLLAAGVGGYAEVDPLS